MRGIGRMKWTALIGIVLMTVLPAWAQTDAADDSCAIDLSEPLALILRAQAAASGGGAAAALEQIAAARAALQSVIDACVAAGVEPEVLLEAVYTAPNGAFTVDVPAGWTLGQFSPFEGGGMVSFGNTPTASRLFTTQMPAPFSGQQGVLFAIVPPEAFGLTASDALSLEDFVSAFIGTSFRDLEEVAEPEFFTRGERSAARITFRGSSFDGAAVVVEREAGQSYIITAGVTAPDELEPLLPILLAMAFSAR